MLDIHIIRHIFEFQSDARVRFGNVDIVSHIPPGFVDWNIVRLLVADDQIEESRNGCERKGSIIDVILNGILVYTN